MLSTRTWRNSAPRRVGLVTAAPVTTSPQKFTALTAKRHLLQHHTRLAAAPSSTSAAALYKPIPEASGGLPLVGHLFSTTSDQYFQFIDDSFNELGSRCVSMTLLGKRILCTRHPDDISDMVKNTDVWLKPTNWQKLNRWIGDGLVSELDAARHAKAREILAPAFKAQAVKDLVPMFCQVAQLLTDIVSSKQGQEIELETLARRATLDVIGRAAFGYDFKALQSLADKWQQGSGADGSNTTISSNSSAARKLESIIDVVKVLDDVMTPAMLLFQDLPVPDSWIPGYGGYVRGVEVLEKVVEDVLQERRVGGLAADDRSLLTFMLKAQQDDPTGIVTDKHIRDQLMTFMLAGSDTTANTLAFCLFEIAKRSEVHDQLQQEIQQVLGDAPLDTVNPGAFMLMPYLTACINESLRLYPAVTALGRANTQEQVFGDHLIPAGSFVLAFNYGMHRHPEFWPRPTEWCPERWLPENSKSLGPQHADAFNPFSAGPRSCIGRYFAVLEMQVIIAVLLRNVRLSSVRGKENVKLYNYFTLNTQYGLFVQPTAA